MEVVHRTYIGRGIRAVIRKRNLQKLADAYYGGSLSELFNDSVDKFFNLNPDTGAPLGTLPPPHPNPNKK
jgi:hypothetical protein